MNSDEPNPYAVSDNKNVSLPLSDYPGDIEPTGTFLIVREQANLPNRCVFTNVPTTDHDIVETALKWNGSPFRLSDQQRTCNLRYSVSAEVRRQHTRINTMTALATGIVIIIVLATALSFDMGLTIWVAVIATAAESAFAMRIRRNQRGPLRIADYRDGRFWIQGLSTEFLLAFREELDL